jgi:hypothetical protein
VRTALKYTDFSAAKLSTDRRVGRKLCAFIDIDIVAGRDDNNDIEKYFYKIYDIL